MNKEEKKKILAFAQEGFEIFYKKMKYFLKIKTINQVRKFTGIYLLLTK